MTPYQRKALMSYRDFRDGLSVRTLWFSSVKSWISFVLMWGAISVGAGMMTGDLILPVLFGCILLGMLVISYLRSTVAIWAVLGNVIDWERLDALLAAGRDQAFQGPAAGQ